MLGNDSEEKSRIPTLCFGLGVLSALLAFLLLNEDLAVALKGRLGYPEFPNYLLFQAVHSLRCAFLVFGLSLMLSAWLWKPVFSKVLAGDLFERVEEKKIAVVLFGVTFPAYLLFEWFAFQRFPATPDEFAYLFQAKLLASGSVTAPTHPLQAFFKSAFIAESGGRLFSIMPAGWSFFLVPWVWVGAPWIANPLLSSLSVLLVFFIGKEVYSRTTGCVAAFLMAVSPFFCYMGGTFFAHPLSLFLVLAATYGAIRIERAGRPGFAYLALGIVMGLIPIVHHFDIFLLVPVLFLLGIRFLRGPGRIRGRILLMAVALLVVFVAFTAWYNVQLTGSPVQVPHEAYLDDGNFLGEIPTHTSIIGISSFRQLKVRVWRLVTQLSQLNLVMFPLAPALIFLPVLLPGRSKWDVVFTCAVLCMFVAYLFYWCWGGLQLGPRYYYPAVGFFYLLIFRGFRALYHRADRRSKGSVPRGRLRRGVSLAFLLVVCFQVGLSSGTLRMIRDAADYAIALEDIGGWFEKKGIRDSLVFLTPSPKDKHTDDVKIFLRVRNEPDLSDTNLTVSDRGEMNRELMDFYPNKRYFLYEIDINRLVSGEEMRWKEISRDGPMTGETTFR
jgi:hypothetical protein